MLSFQTIDPDTLELLKFLSVQPELRRTRLVGGTSLALQYGHRQSVDLDFFGRLPEDINNLIDAVRRAGNNFINAIDWMGLSGKSFMPQISSPHYIVINSDGYMIGGVNDGDNSIYKDEDGAWTPEEGNEGKERVGDMIFPFSVYWYYFIHSYGNFKIPENRVLGWFYGQNSVTCTLTLGLQGNIELEELSLGATICAWDLINVSYIFDELKNIFRIDYLGKNNEATYSMGFDFLGLSYEYSIRHKFTDVTYIHDSQTNTISFGLINFSKFIYLPDGSFNITLSASAFLGIEISFSGKLYYENESQ